MVHKCDECKKEFKHLMKVNTKELCHDCLKKVADNLRRFNTSNQLQGK